MFDHESDLLAVLEKVGQQNPLISVDVNEPTVLDGDLAFVTVDKTKPDLTLNDMTGLPPVMVGDIQNRKSTPVTIKNLFVHHDSHPVVFDVALLRKYGTDWFEWESETLWKEIKEDFHVPSISDHAKAKIQAVKTLHIGQMYWSSWEVFCWITQALNNNIPDWQVLQKPSIAQLFNSVDAAEMVRSGEVFTLEVQSFVAASVLDENVLYAPHPIAFCQSEIDRYLKDRGIESADLITAVQQKYREIIRTPEGLTLEENPVDIQVAKLKVAWDYQALRNKQLKEQLLLLT
jgi:hypothetical protein